MFAGLLGSVEIPLRSLIDKQNELEDLSSIYSMATSQFSDLSSINWKQNTFYLQNSSKTSQLTLKYHVYYNE